MRTVGVAVVLKWKDLYVFELQKKSKWRKSSQGLYVGVGCVGGRVERGETPRQALHREIREEIGVKVWFSKPNPTYLVTHEGKVVEAESYTEAMGAWFSWQIRRPYSRQRILTFLGQPFIRPSPVDLGGLLFASLDTVFQGLREGWTLQRFKQQALVIERTPIPKNAILEPTGTVTALETLLRTGVEPKL